LYWAEETKETIENNFQYMFAGLPAPEAASRYDRVKRAAGDSNGRGSSVKLSREQHQQERHQQERQQQEEGEQHAPLPSPLPETGRGEPSGPPPYTTTTSWGISDLTIYATAYYKVLIKDTDTGGCKSAMIGFEHGFPLDVAIGRPLVQAYV
jgi:hypothetical protein